ncbi:MAG: 3-deoxy-7-phosphoheptulonate synthase, partial [Clostridiales bacterium]|nr:3-deoxy-7-phosphoheptulonate synthase [Clostridiales bacterium]
MDIQMQFIRKLPIPQELKRDFPIDTEISRVKQQRDRHIADILTGRDDRLLVIIGPCSADREDAVLDYMHRLAALAEKVQDRLMIVPRVYTNKPRTKGTGYKGMLHQPDPEKGEDMLAGIIAIRQMHTRIVRETG